MSMGFRMSLPDYAPAPGAADMFGSFAIWLV
jgi:hypothetical protein